MNVIIPPTDMEPIETERCDVCGRLIEDLEELIFLLTAELIAHWELADPRDAWRHTGDVAPPTAVRNSDISARKPTAPPRTPQATIDAFWYLVRLNDPARLKQWLADRPEHAPHLRRLLEKTCCSPLK
jgi:hypothetical protein